MNAFSRSWMITKLTFGVINKDRELLGFAFLSFFFSAVFSIAMIFPSVLPALMENGFDKESLEVYQYVILFLTYFGLAFIATFFNVCVVYTAKTRFEGGDATFSKSINFAFSRLWVIVQWSLLSATVGLILRLLHNLASRLPKIGEIIAKILIGLLGMTWSILTIFVVPVLVYEGLGPIDAVKKSIEALKKTWGENLIRAIGLGFVQLLVFVGIIAVVGAITYGLYAVSGVVGASIGVAIGLGLLLLTGLIFAVANTIYSTALYVYANTHTVASGFNEDVVKGALKSRG